MNRTKSWAGIPPAGIQNDFRNARTGPSGSCGLFPRVLVVVVVGANDWVLQSPALGLPFCFIISSKLIASAGLCSMAMQGVVNTRTERCRARQPRPCGLVIVPAVGTHGPSPSDPSNLRCGPKYFIFTNNKFVAPERDAACHHSVSGGAGAANDMPSGRLSRLSQTGRAWGHPR